MPWFVRCRRKLDCISVLPSSAVSKTGVKISAGLLCCFIRQLVLMANYIPAPKVGFGRKILPIGLISSCLWICVICYGFSKKKIWASSSTIKKAVHGSMSWNSKTVRIWNTIMILECDRYACIFWENCNWQAERQHASPVSAYPVWRGLRLYWKYHIYGWRWHRRLERLSIFCQCQCYHLHCWSAKKGFRDQAANRLYGRWNENRLRFP